MSSAPTPVNAIAFCCKTLFDPAKGISLTTLKDQYVKQAPIKVMTIVTETEKDGIIFKHGFDDSGATELVRMLHDLAPHTLVSHTEFHANSVRARSGLSLPPAKLALIDELARAVNPAQRSVNLAKLVDLYVGGGAQRAPCDFTEGNHTIDQLADANLRDCLLIYTIYKKLSAQLAGAN